ncbi:omptin family outer membrane protease [Yersinia enterocolitica]|uniref:omptin family outer membrane protease n=1 Tax=Yersinia enterocolitica TaxID=630 RepID=UPI00288E5F0F|nr:omptin family outer membrane protease [Yersinia enterocolitica]EKN6234902.1 omptin family outer membrane protease [Yersinia enterocolitica]ELI8088890.1 omptin family outer membrane protease [Yersinia enterocolitica]HDM8415656.1 omptin family outer membrane protease [Yersinia enterocolitica]HDQ4040099.1 omptin family outer membrane protease [Yersinia enterocolitica]
MEANIAVKQILSASVLLALSHSAVASHHTNITDSLTVSTSLGLLNTEANEYVYDSNNRKVSQLDWKTENTPIIKMDVSWGLLSRLTLTARGWSTLSSSTGTMDDYDWLKPDQTKWTDWSHHDKTNLNYANEIDLNAKFWFLKQKNYRIAMMSGYQRNNSSWTAYGGNYNYDNGKNIFTTSDTVTVIGYKQKFDMTYLGLAGSYHYQKFEFNTLLKYSRWVNANGHDEHYSRKLSFKDSNKNSRYYAIVVDAGYYITPSTKLFVEAAWNQYTEGKGATQILNRTTGTSQNHADSSGIAQKNHTIGFGLLYKF